MHARTDRRSVLLPSAAGLLTLFLFAVVGHELMEGYLLDLGRSLNEPSPRYGRFLALWTGFGALAAGALTLAFVRAWGTERGTARWLTLWRAASDRKWIVYGSLLAFVIPAALRHWLLLGTALTDDESAYRFMAHVLASGRLFAESAPFKLFFDNRFLINDGKVFAPYFVGWPALMAPGAWLGVTGYMNALYSALTVPALWGVSVRLVGRDWARVALALFLTAPMVMIGAATETSHTSCLMALAWLTWLTLRSSDDDAPLWIHGAVTTAFSVAFFIRPTSTLGLGGPLLLWWLWQRRSDPRRLAALVTAAVPALIFAGAFLAVNHAQGGSPFTTSYQRHAEYAMENDFRFSVVTRDVHETIVAPSPLKRIALATIALFRLNHDLFGWPSSLVLLLFVGRSPWRRLLGAMIAAFLAVHWIVHDVGIDTFGPMHYFELAWPVLLLTVLALRDLSRRLKSLDGRGVAEDGQDPGRWHWQALPGALVAALVLVGLLGFWPVRAGAVGTVARNLAIPYDTAERAVEDADVDRAVIFTLEPFMRFCLAPPLRGWVFSRKDNHPDLTDDILWLNHITVEADRLMMARMFPDRQGYIIGWSRACEMHLLPLDSLSPDSVPPAPVSGIDALLNELRQP